jgi:hypothetical protein
MLLYFAEMEVNFLIVPNTIEISQLKIKSVEKFNLICY